MEVFESFCDALKKRKILFFAGSGISYASGLPSAPDIMQATVETLLPGLKTAESERVLELQPEVLYETIIYLTGSRESLHLWRSFHADTQKRFNVECIPNIAHLFIVEQAARMGLPVFTTNFDAMFEEAAILMGIPYRVYLPHESAALDKGSLAICKLHGSIADKEGRFSPESLWTTMTEITRENNRWLEFIGTLMANAHLCFVGYSGRDIDLYPRIKGLVKYDRKLPPFWIHRFDVCHFSDEASRSCSAIRVEGLFPSEAFEQIITAKLIPSKVKDFTSFLLDKKRPAAVAAMLENLKRELALNVSLSCEQRLLLLALLLWRRGRYIMSWNVLHDLGDKPTGMTELQCAELALVRARLSHERAEYISCRKYALQALKIAQQLPWQASFEIGIQARCLVSESYRMEIPYDIYFKCGHSFKLYFYMLYVYLHLEIIYQMNRASLFLFHVIVGAISPAAQQEIIEHQVRRTAFIQTMTGSREKGWNRFWIRLLKKRWNRIRNLSYRAGYSAGIANTGKYYFRLTPDRERKDESEHIFSLITHITGMELNLRNETEFACDEGRFDDALKKFRAYRDSAKESGNRLNEIKAIIGIAYTHMKQGEYPLLPKEEKKLLFKLSKGVQGKFWGDYFTKLRNLLDELESRASGP